MLNQEKRVQKKNIGRINYYHNIQLYNPLTFFIYSLVTLIKNKINYKITIRYRYFLINLLGTSVDSLFGVFQDWGDDTIFFQLSQSNSG